jgi:hypothetical protein
VDRGVSVLAVVNVCDCYFWCGRANVFVNSMRQEERESGRERETERGKDRKRKREREREKEEKTE